MTTVKMPRSHNQSLREIQRQRSYWEDVKEVALTIGSMFFFMMCLWGATELYEFGCRLYAENHILKSQLHEEQVKFRMAFVQDRLKQQDEERQRQQYIKKWQQANPKLAGIFDAR